MGISKYSACGSRQASLGQEDFFCQHAPTSWADGKGSAEISCDEFLEALLYQNLLSISSGYRTSMNAV
jgi:hypothetical protein